MATISQLTPAMLAELRDVFELFDGDSDGLLEVEEVSAIWASCGTTLTEAEVLDMVTELKPDLRKLPFEEFVNMFGRPMVDRPALEAEVAATFSKFAAKNEATGHDEITVSSLQTAMADLGRPVDALVAAEMIQEATKGGDVSDGKISAEEFVAMNGVDPTAVS